MTMLREIQEHTLWIDSLHELRNKSPIPIMLVLLKSSYNMLLAQELTQLKIILSSQSSTRLFYMVLSNLSSFEFFFFIDFRIRFEEQLDHGQYLFV